MQRLTRIDQRRARSFHFSGPSLRPWIFSSTRMVSSVDAAPLKHGYDQTTIEIDFRNANGVVKRLLGVFAEIVEVGRFPIGQFAESTDS